ncbi:hypothetical protein Tco_0165730, partial [Tanacetum coccineum]
LQHSHLGIFMIRLHALHQRSAGTNALVVLRDTKGKIADKLLQPKKYTSRLSNTSYMGFQYSVENVVDHLTTTGITAIPGERRSIEGPACNKRVPKSLQSLEAGPTTMSNY